MKSATPASTFDSATRPHRCFRTTADGRIPLRECWPALFAACVPLGDVALQTRHAFARLVHRGTLPCIEWPAPDALAYAATADGTLALHLSAWSQARAWGRLAICDCCGSPGRIELHQPETGEFLHLSAPAELPAADWSHALAPLTAAAPLKGDPTQPTRSPLPRVPLPAAAHALGGGSELLTVLLSALGDEDVPISCQLRTTETTHTRVFIPHRVLVEDGVLSVGDTRSTCQVALLLVRRLAVVFDSGAAVLHVGAAHEELLVSFSAGPRPEDIDSWHQALAATFPMLR